MKVMMLGASQAGKTTYMACMYGLMSAKRGWYICAKDETEGEGLKRIASDIRRGNYPSETDTKREYKFKFQYKYRDGRILSLFEFTWFDYRGGAIDQDDNDPVSAEVENQLNSADALVVFLDASTLDSEKAEKQWRRIKSLCMIYTSRATENNPLSLTIVLTKFDALKDDQIVFKNKREKTIDYVKTFSKNKTGKSVVEFMKTFSKNDNLRCMLAWTAINSAEWANLKIPFCHAMLIGLEKKIKKQLKRLESLEYKSEELDKRIEYLRKKIANRSILIKGSIWIAETFFGGIDPVREELGKKYEESIKTEDRLTEELKKCKEMIAKQKDLRKLLSRNSTGQNGCLVF